MSIFHVSVCLNKKMKYAALSVSSSEDDFNVVKILISYVAPLRGKRKSFTKGVVSATKVYIYIVTMKPF